MYLAVFYYAFVVANRHKLFLYYHLDFIPTDYTTQSRYWMLGLVVSGAILVFFSFLYSVVNKKFVKGFNWQHIFLMCFLPISIGIVTVMSFLSVPKIELYITLVTVFITLSGLLLALVSIGYVAQKRLKTLLLAPFIMGVSIVLVTFQGLDYVVRSSFMSLNMVFLLVGGMLFFSVGIVIVTSVVYKLKKITVPKNLHIYIGGLVFSYLLLPLIHFIIATPSHTKYITDAENFFTTNILLQITTFALGFVVIYVGKKLGSSAYNKIVS